MRESRIEGYAPGFRSPLYPWMQIAGMIISIGLIAEMGILAVALTGIITALSVAWYFFYAGDKLQRQGAIFHVHERLGRKRYSGLEHELLSLLNEKNGENRLAYEEIIARSVITGLDEDIDFQELIDENANILSGRLHIDKRTLIDDLETNLRHKLTRLGNGIVITHMQYEQITTAELLICRMSHSKTPNIPGVDTPLRALMLLVTPSSELGLEVRLMGHLAELVQTNNFQQRWDRAKTDRELRKILISNEHLLHLTAKSNTFEESFIGRPISQVSLPGDCLIAIIYRRGDLIIPHGNTELEAGDELYIIGSPENIRILSNRNEQSSPDLQSKI